MPMYLTKIKDSFAQTLSLQSKTFELEEHITFFVSSFIALFPFETAKTSVQNKVDAADISLHLKQLIHWEKFGYGMNHVIFFGELSKKQDHQ